MHVTCRNPTNNQISKNSNSNIEANKDDDDDENENEEEEENPIPKNEELDAAELTELHKGVKSN